MRRIAVLAAALLTIAGCSGTSEPEPEGAPTERGATKQPALAPPAKLGTTQKSSTPDGDVSVTAYGFKALPSESPPERKGYEYAGVDIRTCVTRAAARISVSWGPWSLRFADDTVVEPVSLWSAEWFRVPLYPGDGREVRQGQCIRGWAVFEVPKGSAPTKVVYAPVDVSAPPLPLEWAVS